MSLWCVVAVAFWVLYNGKALYSTGHLVNITRMRWHWGRWLVDSQCSIMLKSYRSNLLVVCIFCSISMWIWYVETITNLWWRYQMKTLSALLALRAGIQRSPVNSPHKGQWRGTMMFSLIYIWINGWVKICDVGDLRRHRAHCIVTVTRNNLFK